MKEMGPEDSDKDEDEDTVAAVDDVAPGGAGEVGERLAVSSVRRRGVSLACLAALVIYYLIL